MCTYLQGATVTVPTCFGLRYCMCTRFKKATTKQNDKVIGSACKLPLFSDVQNTPKKYFENTK